MDNNPNLKLAPTHEFNSANARKFADLAGISQDLGRALSFIERLKTEPDKTLQDALFTAALITYRRCFNSSMRLMLSKSDVADLRPQAAEIHEYYMAMADKFAAHSVNPFEQVKIGATVFEGQVIAVAALSMRTIAFNEDALNHWVHLISLIRVKVTDSAKTTEGLLLKEATERPISDVIRGRLVSVSMPTDPTAPRQ